MVLGHRPVEVVCQIAQATLTHAVFFAAKLLCEPLTHLASGDAFRAGQVFEPQS